LVQGQLTEALDFASRVSGGTRMQVGDDGVLKCVDNDGYLRMVKDEKSEDRERAMRPIDLAKEINIRLDQGKFLRGLIDARSEKRGFKLATNIAFNVNSDSDEKPCPFVFSNINTEDKMPFKTLYEELFK
jgi:hypothetical protein